MLYYTILIYSIRHYTVLYPTILYYTVLYYTQVGTGDRLAPPGRRPAPRCRGVWGVATPPSEGSGRQRDPSSEKLDRQPWLKLKLSSQI